MFLEKLFNKINTLFVYRLALLSFSVISVGVTVDKRWHIINPLRPDYFITPHIIVYIGIVLILLCFLLLKIRGVKIPIWVFLMFPVFSIFDQIWHNYMGIEANSSPMMFWSPAHWLFILADMYVLYALYKTKIETNKYVLLFHKAFIAFYIIIFFRFILTPLSPFTNYPWLYTNYNIFTTIFCVLIFFTVYKLFKSPELALFLTISTTVISPALTRFFIDSGYVYNTPKVLLPLFVFMFLCMIYEKLDWKIYLTTATLTVMMVFLLQFLTKGIFDIQLFGFMLFISLVFALMYSTIEDMLLEYLDRKGYLARLREFYKIEGI